MRRIVSLIVGIILVGLTAFPCLSAQEETRINIFCGSTGSTNWTLGQAMADLANKTHPWLRFAVVETSGGNEAVRNLAEYQARRKDSITYAGLINYRNAMKGDAPFTAPYTGLRAISKVLLNALGFATLDPDIKTLNDLAGKRVGVGGEGTGWLVCQTEPTLKAAGLWDKITKIHVHSKKACTALLDRKADAIFMSMGVGGPNWSMDPRMDQVRVMAKGKLRFISIPPEVLAKAMEESGYPLYPIVAPQGSFGQGLPAKDLDCMRLDAAWFADKDMDPKIVYEITKFIYEHIADFGDYHAQAKHWTQETMASIPLPEDRFHPGALKLYKEMGIKAGL